MTNSTKESFVNCDICRIFLLPFSPSGGILISETWKGGLRMDKYIGFGHDLDDLIYGETPVRPSER